MSTEAADMADNYMCGPETETRPGAEVGESTRKHGYETMAKRSARRSGCLRRYRGKGKKYTSGRKETLDREEITCFNCGKKVHISRHCPNNVFVLCTCTCRLEKWTTTLRDS